MQLSWVLKNYKPFQHVNWSIVNDIHVLFWPLALACSCSRLTKSACRVCSVRPVTLQCTAARHPGVRPPAILGRIACGRTLQCRWSHTRNSTCTFLSDDYTIMLAQVAKIYMYIVDNRSVYMLKGSMILQNCWKLHYFPKQVQFRQQWQISRSNEENTLAWKTTLYQVKPSSILSLQSPSDPIWGA